MTKKMKPDTPLPQRLKTRRDLTKEDHKKILELTSQGMKQVDIAKKIHSTHGVIRDYLLKLKQESKVSGLHPAFLFSAPKQIIKD